MRVVFLSFATAFCAFGICVLAGLCRATVFLPFVWMGEHVKTDNENAREREREIANSQKLTEISTIYV